MTDTTDRQADVRRLVEAGIALASELDLDDLLQKLVNVAAELTCARYGALGVIDQTGTRLERFVTSGIDEKTRTEIGGLPLGRGILGLLIRDARPLRLSDLSEHPVAVGFPPGHPPMKTFLGVPIILRGVSYGNLYLTEKEGGGDFTEEDAELMALLAAQAAVAIENARLYASATRWLRQLESLNEVGDALVGSLGLRDLLEIVCERTLELLEAETVLVALPTPNGRLRVEVARGLMAEEAAGALAPMTTSKLGRVLARRRSERVDSMLDDPEVDRLLARRLEARSALFVPLVVRDRALGVIAILNRAGHDPRFSDSDLRLAEAFGNRAAVALDLSERVERDALRRALRAQDEERRRLARELHDEAGQALTSILLGISALRDGESRVEREEAAARLRDLTVAALEDVRHLAFELRPKALDDFGLVVALERLAENVTARTALRIGVEARLDRRLPDEVETGLYRFVQEALTNAVKHARATGVSVVVTRRGGSVVALVEDDGRGFSLEDVDEARFGLVAMRERLQLLGGTLVIDTAPGKGTVLRAEVPCESQ